MRTLLAAAFSGKPFDAGSAEAAMQTIIQGEFLPEQLGAFLGALATRKPTAHELTGFARALRQAMIQVPLEGTSLDTCGTGGDGGKTFNISTAVSLILATQGIQVVKHGNRAVSSLSGSTDVLEELHIPVQSNAQDVLQSLKTNAIGFCFAPAFHPALKTVAPIRRNLGIRTVFNLLGPLCNPAQTSHQLLGVFSPDLTPIMAEALNQLGIQEAMVVSALDGLDEISLSGPTQISHLKAGQVKTFLFKPEELGLTPQPLEAIAGADAAYNAQLIERIFTGTEQGASRDIVALNAAAALCITDQAENLATGLARAYELIDSGRVFNKLESLRN